MKVENPVHQNGAPGIQFRRAPVMFGMLAGFKISQQSWR